MSETSGGHGHQGSTLRDYLRVARRRKWIILQAVLLVPAAAVLFSLQQQKLYQASADVYLQQNLANQLNNIPDPSQYQQADRKAQTQADIARSSGIARMALDDVGLTGESTQNFLGASSVTAKQNADLLRFSVTNRDPQLARRLANAYGRAFISYRITLDSAPFVQAKRAAEKRLESLDSGSAAHADLVEKLATVETQLALASKPATLVQPADDGEQVQPRPVRNGILGLALGIVLGIGLAFLWEALDTRVRSAEEITERLGLPLLGRLPEPARKLRQQNKLAMLAEPHGIQAEAFRTLRTNLDFVSLDRDPRTIMITSAIQSEGKSTTVANLAIAAARTGKRVALVDLDLRRPYLDRFFSFDERPGLTEVALGYRDLDEAILSVALTDEAVDGEKSRNGRSNVRRRAGNGNGNGPSKVGGVLDVISAGPIPPAGGDFVGTSAIAEILAGLRDLYDLVLIDAPPLLRVGDGIALSARVDAVVVVTRLNILKRPLLRELDRVLESIPAERLGFIVTGADLDDAYAYDYGDYYRPERSQKDRPKVEANR